MTDRDELEFPEAMVEWAESTHREVRTIRQMVGFFFALWLLGLGAAVVVAATSS